jgi:hypothetical protein
MGSGGRIQFFTSGSEKMRITSEGNVGIGNTNPGAKLEIQSTRNSTILRLTATSGENWEFKNTNTVGSTDVLSIGAAGATANLNLVDNGNVGIGTSSPVTNLEVSGSIGATGLRYSSSPAKQGVYLGNSSATPGTTDYATIEMCGGATGGCEIDFTKPGFDYRGRIGYDTSTDYMWFVTAATERMRIGGDGNIAIGTFATAGDKYFGYSHTNGGWGAGASGLRFESVAVGGNYSQSIYIRSHYYNADSRNAIYCRYDGNVYNFSNSTAWQTTSDIRIKENIRPINNALDKINALNPSHFEYKNKLGQTKTGFVAQEFEQIFPGHVSEGLPNEDYREYFEEGEMMKSIDADLIPYLVKAIQEQQALITALQEKLERNNIN